MPGMGVSFIWRPFLGAYVTEEARETSHNVSLVCPDKHPVGARPSTWPAERGKRYVIR